MVLPALHCVKGGANTMQALETLEKYKRTNYDLCRMGRYTWNIFQWNKNKTKSKKMMQWRLLLMYSNYLNTGQYGCLVTDFNCTELCLNITHLSLNIQIPLFAHDLNATLMSKNQEPYSQISLQIWHNFWKLSLMKSLNLVQKITNFTLFCRASITIADKKWKY